MENSRNGAINPNQVRSPFRNDSAGVNQLADLMEKIAHFAIPDENNQRDAQDGADQARAPETGGLSLFVEKERGGDDRAQIEKRNLKARITTKDKLRERDDEHETGAGHLPARRRAQNNQHRPKNKEKHGQHFRHESWSAKPPLNIRRKGEEERAAQCEQGLSTRQQFKKQKGREEQAEPFKIPVKSKRAFQPGKKEWPHLRAKNIDQCRTGKLVSSGIFPSPMFGLTSGKRGCASIAIESRTYASPIRPRGFL